MADSVKKRVLPAVPIPSTLDCAEEVPTHGEVAETNPCVNIHSVLTVRPDSPALQDAPLIYLRNYDIGQRRAGSGTDLPPPRTQRSEIYSRRCGNPPPAKQKPP